MKFAFILNTDGGHPDTYNIQCQGADFNAVYGVTGVEEGMDYAKHLITQEGYDCINFCGDFTAEQAAEIRAYNVISREAKYLPEELAKVEQLEDLSEYGLIVWDDGFDETKPFDIIDPACNTYIRFVPDVDSACKAAEELVVNGVALIELCGLFDMERTQKVIKAIDGRVPVGSCGLIDL